MATHAQWLKLTDEAPLDPELEICDAHHHFWDDARGDPYLPADLSADIGANNVVSTVFCECNWAYRKDGPEALRPVGETARVAALAAIPGRRAAAGIVGYADLRLGERVSEVLEAHLAASPRFRGVRYWSTWDEHPEEMQLRHVAPRGLLAEASFRKGIASLERHGLVFDAWMLFPQLPEFVDLARAHPGLTIVMGHVGGLAGVGRFARRDETFALWKKNITELAACPNVVMKLGGVGIERLGFDWHKREKPAGSAEVAQAFGPYCLHCIDCFGPERCLFESNFPVDRRALAYTVIWNAFKRVTKGFSPAERAALFRGTAERVYRLQPLNCP